MKRRVNERDYEVFYLARDNGSLIDDFDGDDWLIADRKAEFMMHKLIRKKTTFFDFLFSLFLKQNDEFLVRM